MNRIQLKIINGLPYAVHMWLMTYFFLSRLSRPPRNSRLLPVVFLPDKTYTYLKFMLVQAYE
jgi:hypothetical protein